VSAELDRRLAKSGIPMHTGGRNFAVVELSDEQMREAVYGTFVIITQDKVLSFIGADELTALTMWEEAAAARAQHLERSQPQYEARVDHGT
jgi:hypothetical protein